MLSVSSGTAQVDISIDVDSKIYDIMLDNLLSRDVEEVDVEWLAAQRDTPILLDARELVEYNVSHLRGAIHVGYDNFQEDLIADLDKNKEIIVYCSVGYRSEKITQRLRAKGFKKVYNLYGGLFEWMNEGYAVVDNNGQETIDVHAFDRTWGVWLSKGNKIYR